MQHFRDIATYFACRQDAMKRMNWREYYHFLADNSTLSIHAYRDAMWENEWYSLGQPYYRIYPSILRLFLGINLDVPSNSLCLPLSPLVIQLPDGKVRSGDWVIDNLLVVAPVPTHLAIAAYGVCRGEGATCGIIFPLTSHTVGERVLEAMGTPNVFAPPQGWVPVSNDLMLQCMRIVATLCLIADNPEFVRPDVLAADEDKYERTGDEKYVEKAKRRGKFGWTVGKHVEMSPHFRNGCLAVYWTGHGRTKRTIRWRKESIVHKKVIQSVPQGCFASATDALTATTEG